MAWDVSLLTPSLPHLQLSVSLQENVTVSALCLYRAIQTSFSQLIIIPWQVLSHIWYVHIIISTSAQNVIEVDGNNVQSLVVDSIQIYAGQRYSFILNANQTISNYWIRSAPNNGPQGFTGGVNSAILRYVGGTVADPTTPQVTSINPLLETNLHPLTDPAAPGPAVPAASSNGAVMPLSFNISFNAGTFLVNNVAFDPPSVPVLLQILSGTPAQSLLPTGSVYVLPPDTVIEISIPGGAIGAPVRTFWVKVLPFSTISLFLAPYPSSRTRILCHQECRKHNYKLC